MCEALRTSFVVVSNSNSMITNGRRRTTMCNGHFNRPKHESRSIVCTLVVDVRDDPTTCWTNPSSAMSSFEQCLQIAHSAILLQPLLLSIDDGAERKSSQFRHQLRTFLLRSLRPVKYTTHVEYMVIRGSLVLSCSLPRCHACV